MRTVSLLLACSIACLGQAVRVLDMDEKVTSGKGFDVQGEKLVVTQEDGTKKEIPCDSVVEITFPANSAPPAGKEPQVEVVLANGDVLHGDVAGGDDKKVSLAAGQMGLVDLDEDKISRLYVLAGNNKAKLPPDAAAEADLDRLYFTNLDHDAGFAQKLDATGITFSSYLKDKNNPEQKTYKWDTIAGWFFASPQPVKTPPNLIATVDCAGGTRLTGTILGMGQDTLQLQHVVFNKVDVPVAAIRAIYFVNGRVTYLSDLNPSNKIEHGYDDCPDDVDRVRCLYPWQRDVSVREKRPLRVKGRDFRKGLGVHTFCALEYRLDKQYHRFTSAVGLDEEAGPSGDKIGTALFQVYAGTAEQIDPHFELYLGDRPVKDWKALCSKLVEAEGKAARCPAKAVWEAIPDSASDHHHRDAVRKGAQESDLKDEDRQAILVALGCVIRKEGLHNEQDFPSSALDEEAKAILAKAEDQRTVSEKQRLNRRLVEAALGDAIVPLPRLAKLLWESGLMKSGEEAKEVSIDVSSVDTLVLVAKCGPDNEPLVSEQLGRADWGGARLIK